jgi:hypothetical protein
MLHISRQPAGGFPEAIHERCLWCRLLHGHRCRDVAPFGLDT